MARLKQIDANAPEGQPSGMAQDDSIFRGMGDPNGGNDQAQREAPEQVNREWGPLNIETGMSGETPREREAVQNPTSALRRPMTPTPMAGSSFTAGSTDEGGSGGGANLRSAGVLPFQPMGGGMDSSDSSSLLSTQKGGLFGSLGGLKGGGLGVPLDPISDQQSDPLSLLMKLLQRS